jgi:hypothetical protein
MSSLAVQVPRAIVGASVASILVALLSLDTPSHAMIAVADTSTAATQPMVSGDRRCVAWSKVYVRNYPKGQAWSQLYEGQTFSVYEYRDSGWARGFAWGHINSDKSPYDPPYDNVWIESASLGKHVNDGSTC